MKINRLNERQHETSATPGAGPRLCNDAVFPRLTVITATYNSAKTLEKCILSVIEQKYPDLEYIIVDGGSDDGTLDIIKKYEKHLSWWVSEPDKGIGDAWNKGISNSSGEIIAIIDSDNSYEPGVFRLTTSLFQNGGAVDVVHGNVRFWNGSDNLYVKKPYLDERYFWKFMPYLFPSCFIRRSLYDKYGLFDPSYRLTMDYELLLRFYTSGVNFLYLDEVLANFQLGGVSDVMCIAGLFENKDIIIRHGYSRFMAYCNLYRFIMRRKIKLMFEHLNLGFIVNAARRSSGHWFYE